jgi:predicted HAD superfamily Cof-like phosphohydrolase
VQDTLDSVRQFHAAMNAPISPYPTLLPCVRNAAAAIAERVNSLAMETMAAAPEDDVLLRRVSMALEELAEWLAAHAQGDLVAAADAWTDRAYVLFGDAVAAGTSCSCSFTRGASQQHDKGAGPVANREGDQGSEVPAAGYSQGPRF